jgi:hypothetical protein
VGRVAHQAGRPASCHWSGVALAGGLLPVGQASGVLPTGQVSGVGLERIELVARRYRADGIAFRALRDGQALVVSGADTRVV